MWASLRMFSVQGQPGAHVVPKLSARSWRPKRGECSMPGMRRFVGGCFALMVLGCFASALLSALLPKSEKTGSALVPRRVAEAPVPKAAAPAPTPLDPVYQNIVNVIRSAANTGVDDPGFGLGMPGMVVDISVTGVGSIMTVVKVTFANEKWLKLSPMQRLELATYVHDFDSGRHPHYVGIVNEQGKELARRIDGKMMLLDDQ
jgi:hypothetical protein